MKKIILIVMFLASSLSFTSPTWIEYLIKVDSPQNAAKIVAATDKFMSSEFVKNNFIDDVISFIIKLYITYLD